MTKTIVFTMVMVKPNNNHNDNNDICKAVALKNIVLIESKAQIEEHPHPAVIVS